MGYLRLLPNFAYFLLIGCILGTSSTGWAQNPPEGSCITAELQAFLTKYDIAPNWKNKATLTEESLDEESRLRGVSFGATPMTKGYTGGIRFFAHPGKEGLEPYETRPLENVGFPYSEFLGERWKWENEDYLFINVGSRQFKKDAAALGERVREGFKNSQGREVIIPINSKWVRGRTKSSEWREWASTMVTKVYAERKPYLDKGQLYDLRMDDLIDWGADDYLILMKDPKKSPLQMSSKDFEDHVLAVARVARMEKHPPIFPREFLPLNANRLPHTNRVVEPLREKVYESLLAYEKLKRKKVAEISRFVIFQKTPDPVKDAFIKNIFQIAKTPDDPIDMLVISVDRATKRLFGPHYRFDDLSSISPEGSKDAEYLMEQDTHSKNFADTLADLTKGSQSVVQTPETKVPPESTWSEPWGMHPNFLDNRDDSKTWGKPKNKSD